MLRRGVQLKAIEGEALRADWDLGQVGPQRLIEQCPIHPAVPVRIAGPDEAR
ncbi:MAG: hypothetical protein HYX63_13255 [Gammaproteobacteria bacterium]|nr:hypothetical protein [Gammaproteobacteria bacterium]